MNIAFVGCGYVFDIYMRTFSSYPEITISGVYDIDKYRLDAVSRFYSLYAYSDIQEILQDPEITLVVNLTSISNHYEVSRTVLLAGKNLYSEKPITKSLVETKELFSIAEKNGLVFMAAPANVFSDSITTLIKSVRDGLIGSPRLVYAELDDNPIHKMNFDEILSPSGAPWPLTEEVMEGCTFEHVGYHLVWICALLGPVINVTAVSNELLPNKLACKSGNVGTPDYSVACLTFSSGASARITCSVVAPRNHSVKVIGLDGQLTLDSYRQFRTPVYYEKFSRRSLEARKFSTVRRWRSLQYLFGIEGKPLTLLTNRKSHALEAKNQKGLNLKQRLIEYVRRREVYSQDKFLGIVHCLEVISGEVSPVLTPDFLIHLNELTLIIQQAGPAGVSVVPETSFTHTERLALPLL